MTSKPTNTRETGPMLAGRQADSARRRQRVSTILDRAAASGEEISVSSIARAAGVGRTFLYRHPDLLSKIHAIEAAPRPPRQPPARPSPGRPCKLTCSQHMNAPPGSPRTSASSNSACPAHSASKPGANPGSARRQTSTLSTTRSPIWSTSSPISASSSTRKTRTSPPHAQPTVSSWPASTPHDDDSVSSLHHTCRAR